MTGMSPSGGWRVLEVEEGKETDKQVKIWIDLPQTPPSLSFSPHSTSACDEPRLDDASWIRSRKGVCVRVCLCVCVLCIHTYIHTYISVVYIYHTYTGIYIHLYIYV
jgi:hypothetical protein